MFDLPCEWTADNRMKMQVWSFLFRRSAWKFTTLSLKAWRGKGKNCSRSHRQRKRCHDLNPRIWGNAGPCLLFCVKTRLWAFKAVYPLHESHENLLMANGMGHLSGADVSLGDPKLWFWPGFGANLQKMLHTLGWSSNVVAEMQWWKVKHELVGYVKPSWWSLLVGRRITLTSVVCKKATENIGKICSGRRWRLVGAPVWSESAVKRLRFYSIWFVESMPKKNGWCWCFFPKNTDMLVVFHG